MIRRYVNLVLRDYSRRMHLLHRLDVAKHLFYPSTSDAEAANAKENSNNNGGGGDKPKPLPRILRRLLRLPEPSMRFSPFPPAVDGEEDGDDWPSADDAFLLLSPGTGEGRILHATEGGRTILYDADAGAISAAVPSFPKPIQDPIAFSVPGSGEFMDEKESLYVMRSTIAPPPKRHPLRYDEGSAQQDHTTGDFVVLDFDEPYEWQPLPPPPFADGGGSISITSSAVVGGGRTICVSTASSSVGCNYAYSSDGVERTYCFDTAVREWRHAGDWALPFDGRAEHVPELGTWIGLSSSPPHHLCAADLSAAMDDANNRAPPTPQHVWDDFTPPPDESSSITLNKRFPHYVLRRYARWMPRLRSLVNLGSGRFCIVKMFDITRGESVGFHVDDMLGEEVFSVLTGVEVLRGGDGCGERELRMVKHKSRHYALGCYPWVL
ncbi:unnamed protein product [Urochloa decumbens]|uniref:Uncharacterized protein n=1 Tax=Urochloa decumbens TaxID=240449 RepID=A0ABC9GA38_9POAL